MSVEFKLSKAFEDTRRITFPNPPHWVDLANRIYDLYSVPGPNVGVSYIDIDGDEITISSEQEIQDYYASSLVPGKAFKFTVYDLGARNARQAKSLPDTPRMSGGTFGPGANMPFMYPDADNEWESIPRIMGGGFETGQRPLSFASSDGPHAYVESVPSDASVQEPEDKDDARSSMDTDLGEIIEPTIGKGKEVDRGSLADIDYTIYLLNAEEPVKARIYAISTTEDSSSEAAAIPLPPRISSSVSVHSERTATSTPTDRRSRDAINTPQESSGELPQHVSPPASTTSDSQAPGALMYSDIAAFLTTAASVLAQHPELGEGVRNIVNHAMNGTYLSATDFTRRTPQNQAEETRESTEVIRAATGAQSEEIRAAAESARAAHQTQAESMRAKAEGLREAHRSQATAMRASILMAREAHRAQAEAHVSAAEAARQAHRAGAEAHGAMREAHRAAAEARRGTSEAQRGAAELRRVAEESAGREVVDALGNIFRAFSGAAAGATAMAEASQQQRAAPLDEHSRSPWVDGRSATNPFHALEQAGAMLSHFMLPGIPGGAAQDNRRSLSRQEQQGGPRMEPRISLRSVSAPVPPPPAPPAPLQTLAPPAVPHPPAPPILSQVRPTMRPPPPPVPHRPYRPTQPFQPVPPVASVSPVSITPARTAKDELEQAKRQYKEAKERYRREREVRGENQSGDSGMVAANSQDPYNPAVPMARQASVSVHPTPMSGTTVLPGNTSQVVSTGHGRYPPLEMVNVTGDSPRRTSLHADGSIRRTGSRRSASVASAGSSNAEVRVRRKLADMGFTDASHRNLPSMIELQLATVGGAPNKSQEEEIVARLLEELLSYSPSSTARREL